jgi:lipopolysaccharide export system protein LptA
MSEEAMNPLNKGMAIGLLVISSSTYALQSDRNQPITIDADTAERDESAGTTTYSGRVEMAQGSMRINADEIVIYNTKDKVSKIVAKGRPAQYQQQPSEDEGTVVAKANILEYNLDQESLRLIESASLQQEGTSLSGSRIEYDVRKSVVKAGSTEDQKERVRMVIPPKALRGDENTPIPQHETDANKPSEPELTGYPDGNP